MHREQSQRKDRGWSVGRSVSKRPLSPSPRAYHQIDPNWPLPPPLTGKRKKGRGEGAQINLTSLYACISAALTKGKMYGSPFPPHPTEIGGGERKEKSYTARFINMQVLGRRRRPRSRERAAVVSLTFSVFAHFLLLQVVVSAGKAISHLGRHERGKKNPRYNKRTLPDYNSCLREYGYGLLSPLFSPSSLLSRRGKFLSPSSFLSPPTCWRFFCMYGSYLFRVLYFCGMSVLGSCTIPRTGAGVGGCDFFFFPLRTREKGKIEHTTISHAAKETFFFVQKKTCHAHSSSGRAQNSKDQKDICSFLGELGHARKKKFIVPSSSSSGRVALIAPLLPPRLTGGKEGKAAKREFARWGGNSFGTTKSSRPGKESGTKGSVKHTDLN